MIRFSYSFHVAGILHKSAPMEGVFDFPRGIQSAEGSLSDMLPTYMQPMKQTFAQTVENQKKHKVKSFP